MAKPRTKTPAGFAVLNTPIHFRRFDLNKSGQSVEEIAKADGVAPGTVKKSIEAVVLYRTRHTHENMNQALTGVVMSLGSSLKNTLSDALKAKIEIKDGNRTTHEPDHTTRLKAVSEIRQIAQVVQPKASPSTNVSVGVGVNQSTRVASGGYVGMEDRLREIRQKRSEQPVLEGKVVAVAELEQADGEFSMDDEGDPDE